MTAMLSVIGALRTISKGLVKALEDLDKQKKSRNKPYYSIIKIG